MIFLIVIILLLTLFNTALLLALCGAIAKLLGQNSSSNSDKKFVPDTPVPRQPNYADFIFKQQQSEDLRLVKDE